VSGTGKGWRRVDAFNRVYYRDYDGQWDWADVDHFENDLTVMQFGGLAQIQIDTLGRINFSAVARARTGLAALGLIGRRRKRKNGVQGPEKQVRA
jgi:hypothetical protein